MQDQRIDQAVWKRLRDRAELENCSVDVLLQRLLAQDAEPLTHHTRTHPPPPDNTLREWQIAQLIDHLPLAIAMFDTDMRYLQVNRAWREQYRLGDIAIIGRSHYDIFPEIGDDWKAIHQRCLGGDVDINERVPFPRQDGSLDWLRWEIRPWFVDTAQTEIGGLVMYTEVITGGVEAEQAQIDRENTLKLALDAAHAGVWLWDAVTDCLIWDTGMEAIYGLAPGTFGGSNDDWRSFVHPDDLEQSQAEIREGLVTGKHFTQTFRIVRPDGEIRHILAQAIITRDETTHEPKRVVGVNSDITEQMQAERALRASEQRYRLLSDLAFEGIVLHDQGVPYDVNPALLKMFGYERDELIGKQIIDMLFTPESTQIIQENIRKQHAQPYEVIAVRKDGSQFPLELEARQIDDNLRVTCFRDIIERKRTEEEIRQNQHILEQMFNHSHFLMAYLDAAFNFIRVNKGYAEADGKTPAYFVGKNLFNLYPNEENEVLFRRVVETGVPLAVYANLFVYPNNPERGTSYWDWSLRPVLDAEGKVEGLVLLMLNVTRRKKMEINLRESEEKYRQLVEHSHQGMVIAQANPVRLCFASSPMTKLIGYTPDELTRFSPEQLATLVHPDDSERFFTAFQERLAGKDVNPRSRYRFIHRSDKVRYVDTYSTLIEYEGEPATQTVFLDVTEQVEIERLQSSFQKEQEQNALIQRVISMLSHDMRTPLAVISSSRDILARHYTKLTDEHRRAKLDTIGRQVQLALEMLEDTVNTARGGFAEREFKPAPLNLPMLCQVSIDEVSAANNTRHRFVFDNVGNVGMVSADEVLVSRILLNLLVNAIKYSPASSEIRLELDQTDGWVVLRVVDHGMGIGADDLLRIFEPFYRADNALRVSGTGLGLNIVQDCVQRHGGHTSVESAVGRGSTFIVELPIYPIPPERASKNAEPVK